MSCLVDYYTNISTRKIFEVGGRSSKSAKTFVPRKFGTILYNYLGTIIFVNINDLV